MQNIEARDAFIRGEKSLKEASELTDITDENIRLYLTKALQNLTEAQKIVHRSNSPNKSDRDISEEIIESADVIRRNISKRLREKEEI